MKLVFVLICGLTFFSICNAQSEVENSFISTSQQKSVLDHFSKELQDNYIFPDSANLIVDKLRNLYQEGYFKDSKDAAEFAKRCTDVIRSVVHDNHLGIKHKPNYAIREERPSKPRMKPKEEMGNPERQEPVAYKLLANEIGYLRIDNFDEQPIFYDKIDEAFRNAETTKALIIDLSNCGGGSPTAENYVISYLLNPNIQLTSIFQNREKIIIEETYFTLPKMNENRYTNQPVYVLTGHTTFSAAENFCYDLQTLKRATIVGVQTKGGANPGREFSIGESFFSFIPTGRSFNHLTQTNWEGSGILPDIPTTENESMEKAINLINQD